MYTIYAYDNGWKILHYPFMDDEGKIVINPILNEALNTHGSLEFSIAPTNPFYDLLEPRNTKIKVVSDTKGRKPWFGRVMEITQGWDACLNVYCEGELGCLLDSHRAPYGFSGNIVETNSSAPGYPGLLPILINAYNGSNTRGYVFAVGNVSVTDPNGYIVRSSNMPQSIWEVMRNALFESSLGGYIMPRYDEETDTHYIDYLALDDNDQYAHTSTQVIKFGQNLLDFKRYVKASDIMTVIVPYGAQFDESDTTHYEAGPPTNGTWNGNRLKMNTDRPGVSSYVENQTGIDMWGRIVGFKIWDDVTIATNLETKATAWLAQQIWESVTLEINAVDLSFVDADIEQIQVGDYVRVQSKPHGINVLLLCTSKTTYLTQLENSAIILGAGQKTITNLQSQSLQKEDLN